MKIIKNPDLADYSSIHIGGLGNFLYLPQTESELLALVDEQDNPFILGGGTNVVFADGFKREVISLLNFSPRELYFSANVVSVSAGVKLSRLVYEGCRAGYSGVEALAGIPGTVGGAIVMNAGSRYGSISQFVRSIRVLSFKTSSARTFTVAEMEYSYRKSMLQHNPEYIVIGAEFEFPESAPAGVLTERASRIIKDRITSSIKLPNCGSVFKNPEHELSAGEMVDRLGLKGYKIGGIAVSKCHGNIFVNESSATYSDFAGLVEYVRNKVFAEFSVDLRLEIRVLS